MFSWHKVIYQVFGDAESFSAVTVFDPWHKNVIDSSLCQCEHLCQIHSFPQEILETLHSHMEVTPTFDPKLLSLHHWVQVIVFDFCPLSTKNSTSLTSFQGVPEIVFTRQNNVFSVVTVTFDHQNLISPTSWNSSEHFFFITLENMYPKKQGNAKAWRNQRREMFPLSFQSNWKNVLFLLCKASIVPGSKVPLIN